MKPTVRECRFVNCPVGYFIAHRPDTKYCSARCRSNAVAHRRGRTLIGTGVRGGAAVKFYASTVPTRLLIRRSA